MGNDATVRGLNGATASIYAGDDPVPEDHLDLVVAGGGHTAGIVMPVPALAQLAGLLSDALRERYGHDLGTVAGVLTPAQHDAVAFFRGLNVPAAWFVGEPDGDGTIEVIALGDTFAWAIKVSANGETHTSEATLGPFETGISC
jgi:hypothetical protein